MLNWKSLGFGIVLAVVLSFMFYFYNLQSLTILSFIIAPLIGGYIVGGDTKTGAIHGAIIGFFGSIIAIFSFSAMISYFSHIPIVLGTNLIVVIALCIIYAVIGAIFCIIGAAIKNRAMKN